MGVAVNHPLIEREERLIYYSFCNGKSYTIRLSLNAPNCGYNFYAFDEKGFNTHDYIQGTIGICKEQALEDFDVPMDSWKELNTF